MGIENIKWVYARKEYTCRGCGETIPEGARYQSGVKKDGGRLVRIPLCERCSYAATNQEGCWADYFLWCYRNGYEPATGKKKEAK